jgi:hypothetical protein
MSRDCIKSHLSEKERIRVLDANQHYRNLFPEGYPVAYLVLKA